MAITQPGQTMAAALSHTAYYSFSFGGIIVRRAFAIILSLAVAAVMAYTMSVGLGILLGLACILFQLIREYSGYVARHKQTSPAKGLALDIARSAVFLIALIAALWHTLWLMAVG